MSIALVNPRPKAIAHNGFNSFQQGIAFFIFTNISKEGENRRPKNIEAVIRWK